MRLARLALFASLGLVLVGAAGCYSPYRTPAYGTPYGYPSAPVQTLTPGGTYAPGMPPSGSYMTPTPSGTYSQPTPSGTYQPGGSSSDAPFYNNSSSAPPYDPNKGVPQPFDPGEVRFEQSKPKPIAEDSNMFEQGSLQSAGASTENVAKVTVDGAEFYEPIRSVGQEPEPTPVTAVATAPGMQSPFAHDAENHRWLRGIARRNNATGAWSLVYSTVQVESDPFHGWLTLAPDPRLDELEPERAYLVSGQIDESQSDPSGKPLYRVQSITAWEPSATF